MSDDENAGPKPGPSGQVSQSRREQYIGIPGEFDEQEDWESYVARVKLFWRVNKVAEEDKTDQFLLFVGRNAFEKLTTLCAPAEPEEKSLQELIALLGRYYKPKPSIMAERFKFYNRKQMANESVAEYEAELRRLAKTCEFTASFDAELTPLLQSLRDQFVFGLNNEAWQRRLLQEPGVLTFTRAVEITKAAEAAQKNAQQFNIFRGSSEVHRVMPKSKGNKPQNEGTKGKQHFSNSKKFVKCFNCGKDGHYARDCRASRKAPLVPRKSSHSQIKHVSEETVDFAEPTNVTELKSFLGMVVYFAKFLPQLSERAAPLNELLKKGTPWMWNSAKSAAFNGLKEDLMSMPVLMHFNPKLPLGLACDASSSGIGAVLFHILPNGDERPIAYASKSLTPAERNYSQIEKEGLSIVFGVKKFHQYLWGHTFKLVTDHKPLVTIFGSKKGIPTIIASRLQRWSIILSAYTYEIVYKSTAKHGNADGLSRLSCGFDPHFESGHALVDLIEYEVFGTLPVSVDVVKDASKRDAVFSRVIDDICNGRKLSRNSSFEDGEISVFCRREAELTVCDGILIWGSRVVVPKELRGKLLNELHAVHSGIVRMKSLAREHFWWPGMDGEIENIARSCCACQENGNNLQKVPLHPWQLPERAWERLHIDLAGPYFGFMWLVVEDAFSKWPEVIKLRTATSATVATNLMKIFAVQGLPEQLVSDNGSQFTSVEFKEFCKYRGISNCYVTPYHPQANGQVERFIQTFKKCMNKMAQSGNNLDYNLNNFLLTYRIIKHSSTNEAPCQLLMGRKLRTRFDLIHPREKDVIDNKTAIVQDRVRKSQEKGKYYHDRTAKMREFEVGDHVWARNYSKRGPKFVRAKIHHKISPLSYKVFVREGLIWRRHSQQLKARFKRGQSLYREDDDIPIASSEQPHDDAINCPEINAEEENFPIQRRSTRTRRQPERLNYKVLGGLD